MRRLQNKWALRAGREWVAAPCLFKDSLACLPKITWVAAASQHARLSRNESGNGSKAARPRAVFEDDRRPHAKHTHRHAH